MTAAIRLSKPCGECGGNWRGVYGRGRNTTYAAYPCPSCVGGWLPDDETVEAAAESLRASMPTAPYVLTNIALAALVAAARYQSEKGEG